MDSTPAAFPAPDPAAEHLGHGGSSSLDGEPVAIEGQVSASEFDPANLMMFRQRYPKGVNYVVTSDVSRTYRRSVDETEARFVGLDGLIEALNPPTVRKDGTRA